MTKEEMANEASSNIILLSSLSQSNPSPNEDNVITDTIVTDSSITTISTTAQPSLNFVTCTSAFCLDAIVKQQQLQPATESIKSEKDAGDTMATRLQVLNEFLVEQPGLEMMFFEICKDN